MKEISSETKKEKTTTMTLVYNIDDIWLQKKI